MTAFARAQQEADGLVLVWELRSVNHRFLETQVRLPEPLRSLEPSLRELVRQHLKRGKVDCTLRADSAGGPGKVELNRPLLLQLLAILEQVRRDAPEVGAPNPMDLLRWPGMLGGAIELAADGVAEAAADLFEEALTELIAHRQREGAQLLSTITTRLDDIDRLVNEIKRQTASIPHQLQQRLQQRLKELRSSLDEDRLEQEVALLAQRADVAEELDRLVIHVEEIRTTLRGAGPHGRRLDFLTQELNREANTLGAKAVLAQTSQRAVDLKVVIEQIREQVQNLE
ncbi:MAG: YicC/YloC family endoribonuclease [Pseudomonadales bacterium]